MGNQYRHVFLMAFAASFVGGKLVSAPVHLRFLMGAGLCAVRWREDEPNLPVPGGLGRIAFPKTRGVTVL